MTAPPLKVGVFPLGEGEVRVTLSTERGARVVDVRSFAPFAHVLMPNRSGLTLPVPSVFSLSSRTCWSDNTMARSDQHRLSPFDGGDRAVGRTEVDADDGFHFAAEKSRKQRASLSL